MGRKPVVSLEDRVPQLKQRRRKKANRRLLAVVLLFIGVILVVLYLQSPFSKIQTISVSGSQWLSEEEIIAASGVKTGDSYWSTNNKSVEENISDKLDVEAVTISKKFPTTFKIEIDEYDQIAYVAKEQQFIPVLENGASAKPIEPHELSSDAPMLFGFTAKSMLTEMSTALASLPPEVQQSISEVYLTPSETDKDHITVYMNDGFEVSALINTFAEKMTHYPSIVSQLDKDVKGVIDLEVGSYFRAYNSSDEMSEEEPAEGEEPEGVEDVETEG
ncbi:FtsQ-type POTRA domain-containing protein [Jeotgalibacillus sp. S-D1]|uniref:cell division protein FtsQ/DivIB n=1 Tax=Jeotgalibacillus sp. S-D1 TaxID=2552189 RepID=UPI00105A803E|nr:FtsQ-type POTRA domain-containing protein [Jeotgalibacillus sp. S-D1]TDL35120.1 FtsQ-type POTRA domain-containing protein [Jeotgalibacillus sp. S-D1]